MKKVISILLSVMFVLGLCACGTQGEATTTEPVSSSSIVNATSLEDLAGMKIGAQTATFHYDALDQIRDVQKSEMKDFSLLLTALKAKTIDGYVAEKPTALSVILNDDTLTYVDLKNNSTGFTTTPADTGIAVAVKKGNELLASIDAVLNEISVDTKEQLMEQMVKLAAGQEIDKIVLESEEPANPNGTLKVAMECDYKPFNWTDMGEATIGAVPISTKGLEDKYANGYDVQIAKYIANKLGMKLEIYALDWESLIPALNAGTVDAICAGMSPTAERAEVVDFTQTYYESDLVIITNK